MEELERDIKLNYVNIIKLMDIEPFYEIMHRYNLKVNKIRQIFSNIKNQPAEIAENPLRVKSEQIHESFMNLIVKRVDNFLSDSKDSIESPFDDSLCDNKSPKYNSESYNHSKKHNIRILQELEMKLIPPVIVPPLKKVLETNDFTGDTHGLFDSPRKKVGHSSTQTASHYYVMDDLRNSKKQMLESLKQDD